MTNTPEKIHSFHIPVMGTAFSIDTPIKVAKYGISSVISLVDDTLIESMRKFYCSKMGLDYTPITKKQRDYRAKRITAYLDLVDQIVKKQFNELKASAFEIGSEITKYFEMLPEESPLKSLYNIMLKTDDSKKKEKIQEELRERIHPGDIDVNIMTKVDRPNFDENGEPLPSEFSDALAAFRGFAQSKLKSSIVFSAGINQRLYSCVEEFKDFYADAKGQMKKKIVLKVSDFRSSLIQGKFFAKKGLWISEFRVESGLNCGGHAFISNGYLLGPILEEFKNKKHELVETLHNLYSKALDLKKRTSFSKPHEIKITAQGGIGSATEDGFLRKYFKLDGTGWATPFLFVKEASNVDDETSEKLYEAGEKDLYLSNVSPVGVPFNNLRSSASEMQKEQRKKDGKPGSFCPLGHLATNTEFEGKPLCVASRSYQSKKLKELESLNLPKEEHDKCYDKITDKSCICYDLGAAAIINNHIEEKGPSRKTAICPGPNAAHFKQNYTLDKMIDHIYGRCDLLDNVSRPHVFIQEMQMYIDCLKRDVRDCKCVITAKQIKIFNEFKNNLFKGIEYYRDLFAKKAEDQHLNIKELVSDLDTLQERLELFVANHPLAFAASQV